MIRRPPRSTLFPYTRSSDLLQRGCVRKQMIVDPGRKDGRFHRRRPRLRESFHPTVQVQSCGGDRLEEDTSGIQAPCKLVCRPLLAKKKHTDAAREYVIERIS